MRKLLLATTALLALSAPAAAAPVVWDFAQHPGALGTTQSFSSGIFNLSARGFTGSDVGSNLYSKTLGGDENGLGLRNDPSGDNEITGKNFVQLNLDGLLPFLSGFQFSMGSTTQGEGWKVYGSEDSNPFSFTLLASSSGTNDEGLHNLAGGWDNYNFFYSGGAAGLYGCGLGCDANVLLHSFDATVQSSVPEASTWAMMLLGFLGIGLTAMRKSKFRFA